MRNIDTFNIFAADILSTVLGSFPSPAYLVQDEAFGRTKRALEKLYPEGIEHTGSDWVAVNERDRDVYLANLTTIWNDTAIWLREAGYIRFDDDDHSVFQIGSIMLTPKGLEVLNARLESLDPSRSIGEILSDAANWSGSVGAQAMIQSGIETALGLGVRMLLPDLTRSSS